MEKYQVRLSPQAKKDIRDIVDYVNTLSPDAALKLYDSLMDGIASLAEMPERCVRVSNTQLRAKGYRSLPVKNFTVYFVFKKDFVAIRRILYSKRDSAWLLRN